MGDRYAVDDHRYAVGKMRQSLKKRDTGSARRPWQTDLKGF